MTSVAIYARVSSARQKKDQTIGSQTAALRAHAAEKRLELPEEWVFEDEGHSGATLVRPALERLRDLVAQVGVDVVLCYAPDRLARKFAYQALLIEEFARAGTRVEFVRGPRGDSPEDQLMVQFQGMFAEYEKAQLMERYRRGKTYRARSGSVNVLGGAPFGYRYLRKTPECGATYEIVESEAVLVVELFRRYTDDGASIADLTRWLTSSNIPTRTGKTRWDRSVVWGMLRNPAYKGQAAFGKTQTLHESPGLNRRARLEGRSTPRAVKAADRPHEEWITIPVPALITPATFERAAQRLADNKRFASRNSKIPSLLQGLSACVSCGYGYYRTSTTTSSGKKIYYYRCLGSDDYRYEGGRVCANKPVRADYLDTVVWDHIIGMIADPHLIRTEIDKRLERARTSDPATRQRGRLELALAKATTAITRMIEAFQEQLVTLDELRSRMPDLRARESNLRGQLAALDASIADRDAYLKLADDLKGFLAQLRDNAESAEVPERQRVLRLLVKDVLIGPEKITIRHRIPVRERATDDGQLQDQDATEGDSRPSYPLRWGRQDPALRGAGLRRLHRSGLPQDSGLQERLDQGEHALVLDPGAHPVHEGRVVDRVEARLDVRVQDLAVALSAPEVDLGDRVVRPPVGAEPVGDRRKVGLEDGFQHQFQCGLDYAVGHGRDAQTPQFPAVLGDHPLAYRQRAERPLPQLLAQLVQEHLHAHLLGDGADRGPVHAGSAGTGVAGHPVPRQREEPAVAYQVVQIIEAAAGIGRRPAVQLGLHLPYPQRPHQRRVALRGRSLHPGVFEHCSPLLLVTCCRPSPCTRLSRARTTTAAPPRPDPVGRRWAQPGLPRRMRGPWQDRDGSRVHL
jgi:site-specific DNA recombinase